MLGDRGRRRFGFAAAAWLVALGACGDGDASGPASDAGAAMDADTKSPPVVWMPRDTGPPPSLDAGQRYDRECTLLLDALTGAPAPRCASATLDCLYACPEGDDGCDDACYAADPTPESNGIDCNGCATGRVFSCMIDAGCDSEVNAFLCCFEDECLGAADGCAEQKCIAHLQGIFTCAVSKAPHCLDPGIAAASCFPSDEDAGP